MAHQSEVKATPRFIRLTEKRGYELIVRITDGPAAFIDRSVSVSLTLEQLNAIESWDPTENYRLDLNPTKETQE